MVNVAAPLSRGRSACSSSKRRGHRASAAVDVVQRARRAVPVMASIPATNASPPSPARRRASHHPRVGAHRFGPMCINLGDLIVYNSGVPMLATVQSPRSGRRRYSVWGSVLVVLSTVLALAGCGAEEEGPHLDLSCRGARRGAGRHRAARRRPGDPDRARGSGLDEELGSRSSGPTSAAARRRWRRSARTRSTSARSPTSRRSSPSGPAPTSRSSRPAARSTRWTTRPTSSGSRPAPT